MFCFNFYILLNYLSYCEIILNIICRLRLNDVESEIYKYSNIISKLKLRNFVENTDNLIDLYLNYSNMTSSTKNMSEKFNSS